MATRQNTDIKRRAYRVLTRDPQADGGSVPVDWSTFFATFTEMGHTERDTLELPVEVGDTVILDDGARVVLGYNLDGSFKLLQTGDSEITEFEALNGKKQDVMFYAETATPARVHVFHDITLDVFLAIGSNEVDGYTCNLVKDNAPTTGDIYISYDQP